MGVLQDFKESLQCIGVFLPDLLQQGMDGNPIFHIIRYVFSCYFQLREEIVERVCHFEPLIHFNINQTDAGFLFNTVLIIEGVEDRSVLEKDHEVLRQSGYFWRPSCIQNAWEIRAFCVAAQSITEGVVKAKSRWFRRCNLSVRKESGTIFQKKIHVTLW